MQYVREAVPPCEGIQTQEEEHEEEDTVPGLGHVSANLIVHLQPPLMLAGEKLTSVETVLQRF